MKKLIAVILIMLVACCALTSCKEKEPDKPEPADTLEAIKQRGYITIAMEGAWAPWTYHDEDDKLVGYDVEVGQAIADYLGVEARFVEGEWDGLLAGLDAGRYDVMINGVDYTEERAEKYYFSDPYMYYHTALMVQADNTDITSFEDLKGKKTANSAGSTYEQLALDFGAECTTVDSLDETLELLISGRIDATLNAEVSFYDYLLVHPDAPIKMVDFTKDSNQVVIPMRKVAENLTLQAEINKCLAAMKKDGRLSAISIKYFNKDHSTEN